MATADTGPRTPDDYFLPRSRPLSRLHVYERAAAVAPLAIRLTMGVVMAAHGAQKLTGLGAAAAGMEAMGFSPGTLWAPLVGLAELLAGVALLVGLATRFAAFTLLFVQLVALIAVHLPNGLFLNWAIEPGKGHGIEFSLVNVGALVALLALGSGRAGVDEAIRRRRGRGPRPARGETVATAGGSSDRTPAAGGP